MAAGPPEKCVGDRIDQAVVERYLERAGGRMIDVNFHIITGPSIAANRLHPSFLRLAELGVLDADFARRIARATGLRNRLAPGTTKWTHVACSRGWRRRCATCRFMRRESPRTSRGPEKPADGQALRPSAAG